jgi:hypothetical protein
VVRRASVIDAILVFMVLKCILSKVITNMSSFLSLLKEKLVDIMKQYTELLKHIMEKGALKSDRTGTGTKSAMAVPPYSTNPSFDA